MRRSAVLAFLALTFLGGPVLVRAATNATALKLTTAAGYLPQVPFLICVDAVDSSGQPERGVWNLTVNLDVVQSGVSLSTNTVLLRNGRGSVLVTATGNGNFELKAQAGNLEAIRTIRDRSGESVSTVGGVLTGVETIWTGVVRVTSDVTVPVEIGRAHV